MAGNKGMSADQKADSWEMVNPLLEAMFSEFKDLSKKKPDGAVSKAKIGVVNRLLEACRQILADEGSLVFLDVLEEDDVPQNSDVTLMLSQYAAAMDQFRSANFGWDGSSHSWHF